jgi:hypothetical protein
MRLDENPSKLSAPYFTNVASPRRSMGCLTVDLSDELYGKGYSELSCLWKNHLIKNNPRARQFVWKTM